MADGVASEVAVKATELEKMLRFANDLDELLKKHRMKSDEYSMLEDILCRNAIEEKADMIRDMVIDLLEACQ